MSRSDRCRRIAVVGPGEASVEQLGLAEEVGREIARRGALLLCGGLGGCMEAAARGARSAGGTSIGFLPGYD
ncbi:MAG: TIGR00725 family protein, partial [Candidatus Krumholzibacteriia bacterium]